MALFPSERVTTAAKTYCLLFFIFSGAVAAAPLAHLQSSTLPPSDLKRNRSPTPYVPSDFVLIPTSSSVLTSLSVVTGKRFTILFPSRIQSATDAPVNFRRAPPPLFTPPPQWLPRFPRGDHWTVLSLPLPPPSDLFVEQPRLPPSCSPVPPVPDIRATPFSAVYSLCWISSCLWLEARFVRGFLFQSIALDSRDRHCPLLV